MKSHLTPSIYNRKYPRYKNKEDASYLLFYPIKSKVLWSCSFFFILKKTDIKYIGSALKLRVHKETEKDFVLFIASTVFCLFFFAPLRHYSQSAFISHY